jgi:hypothetical protein
MPAQPFPFEIPQAVLDDLQVHLGRIHRIGEIDDVEVPTDVEAQATSERNEDHWLK